MVCARACVHMCVRACVRACVCVSVCASARGKMSVWVCGVNASRVCMACYSTNHRVMSQVRDDLEGFLKAQEEEKVIVYLETSPSV